MEVKNIIKWWNLPRATIVNKNLPKNQIFSNMKSSKDKLFITNYVQSIYLVANFKTDNTNIPAFESNEELYKEIWVLYIKTKFEKSSDKIFKILSELIPYPIILIAKENHNFKIYTGRFKRRRDDYLKLESLYHSCNYDCSDAEGVFKKIHIDKFEKQHLKSLYDSLRNKLINDTISKQYDLKNIDITAELKDTLDTLETQINRLKKEIKKESQLNKKIELQLKLKELKDRKIDILRS